MSKNSKNRREQKKKKAASKRNSLPQVLRNLQGNRKRYIKEWDVTSSFFQDEGHYQWMSSKVSNYLRVLEIGCGVGWSTLALLQDGHKVVSIDENPSCLSEAKRLLEEKGFSVICIERGKASARGKNNYSIKYKNIETHGDPDALLIEGDVLGDKCLKKWLASTEHFDAVACWLLGTHNSRGNNTCIDLSVVGNAKDHRLFVQNEVYELADVILRNGGVLNVIDRGQYPDTQELVDDFKDGHKDQASVTSLDVKELDFREYKEPKKDGATQMMITIPDQNKGFDLEKMALISISSIKP